MEFWWVFVGGGLGSVARHGLNLAAARWLGWQFPAATLVINVLGAFAMGMVVEYWARHSGLSPQVRLLLTTGVLGGFTTFSTFSLEVVQLGSRGQLLAAALYAGGSVMLGIVAVCAGMALVRWWA